MIADDLGGMPTGQRVERFRGAICALRTDEVLFDAVGHQRDYLLHFGAVAVVALDAEDRVLVIQQYRHPVAARLWEIPAGLLDKVDEDPLTAAQRELAEEAGYSARDWHVLVDYATTPGGSTELLRIYLARDLTQLPERPRTDEAEEQDMPVRFIDLDNVVQAALAGTVCNTSIVVGSLAASRARASDWTSLRPSDAGWPMREHLARHDRIFRA